MWYISLWLLGVEIYLVNFSSLILVARKKNLKQDTGVEPAPR